MVATLTWMAGSVALVCGITAILSGFITGLDRDFYIILFLFLVIPSFLYTLGKLAIKYEWVQHKNNYILNRRTGMVTIPGKRGQTLTLPFDEFDPYLITVTNPTGSSDFAFHLGHRYSSAFFQLHGAHSDYWYVYQNWEFWQQYMDISQPLPDVPYMESFRSRDPVTAEFDRRTKRPPDAWKNLDLDTAHKMKMASVKAVEKFPWGSTRAQALASGWKPSGYGEGPSSRFSLPRVNTEKPEEARSSDRSRSAR